MLNIFTVFFKYSFLTLFSSIFFVACSDVQDKVDSNIPSVETKTKPSATPTPVSSVSIPHATITYYDISGTTASELRSQINAKRPKSYDAYTQWFIRWNWPGYGSPTCNLDKATVSYEIEVIMPRWKPQTDVSPQLVTKWNNYIRVLAQHEKGHVDNVIANYQPVQNAIASATCKTAESKAKDVLERIRQSDIDYDQTTNHGETQGARFP